MEKKTQKMRIYSKDEKKGSKIAALKRNHPVDLWI